MQNDNVTPEQQQQLHASEALVPVKILREKNGHFVKGRSANPSGKPKGTSQKRTERLKMLMESALVDRWQRYLEAMDSLNDKDFVQEYRALLEFRFPKMARVEATNINIEEKKVREVFVIGGQSFEL